MSCLIDQNSYCCGVRNVYPDEFILSYSSIPIPNEIHQCVSCKFSIHPHQESQCVLGTEEGRIMICDAKAPIRGEEFIKTSFCTSSKSVVLDVCYIPGQPNSLISLSSAPELWDIETTTSLSLFGHEDSVRCASIWPENPSYFLTGSRDGSIIVWDLRERPTKRMGRKGMETSIAPARKYPLAHEANVSITSLLHLSGNYFISSSTSSSSGLRIWDLRYQIASTPLRTLFVPQRMSKESGVASMCWDRFRSSFFAACTDNAIYEYMPALNSQFPINTLRAKNIDSFFVQCSTSPISDHLLCGSSHAKAFMWDLQRNRTTLCRASSESGLAAKDLKDSNNYLPYAKFVLDGHHREVECAQWSPQGGQFMVTIDSETVRIWSRWAEKKDSHGYPDEIIVNHRPIKLLYPTLQSADEPDDMSTSSTSQSLSQPSFGTENQRPNEGDDAVAVIPSQSHGSPFSALHNLPSLYLNPLEGTSWRHAKRARKSIVIKSNLTFTPAQQIPRVEGFDNITSTEKKTPKARRNLMAEFQKSVSKKRPSSRLSSSGGIKKAKTRKKKKDGDGAGNDQQTPIRSASTILDYFSKIPTPKSSKSQ